MVHIVLSGVLNMNQQQAKSLSLNDWNQNLGCERRRKTSDKKVYDSSKVRNQASFIIIIKNNLLNLNEFFREFWKPAW